MPGPHHQVSRCASAIAQHQRAPIAGHVHALSVRERSREGRASTHADLVRGLQAATTPEIVHWCEGWRNVSRDATVLCVVSEPCVRCQCVWFWECGASKVKRYEMKS